MATQGVITTSFRPIAIDNSIPGKDAVQAVDSLGCVYSSELMNPSDFSSRNSIASPNGFTNDDKDKDDISVISNGGHDLVSIFNTGGLVCKMFHRNSL